MAFLRVCRGMLWTDCSTSYLWNFPLWQHKDFYAGCDRCIYTKWNLQQKSSIFIYLVLDLSGVWDTVYSHFWIMPRFVQWSYSKCFSPLFAHSTKANRPFAASENIKNFALTAVNNLFSNWSLDFDKHLYYITFIFGKIGFLLILCVQYVWLLLLNRPTC